MNPDERHQDASIRTNALQFSKYSVAAAGATALDWFAFLLLGYPGISPVVAQMIARVGGGVFSFMLNKFWSFDKDGSVTIIKSGRRFLLLYGFSYVLSISIFALIVNGLDISLYIAKLIADSTCFCVNFLFMRHYTFHQRSGPIGVIIRYFSARLTD